MNTFDDFFYWIITTVVLIALMFWVAAIKIADTVQEKGLKNIVNEVWEWTEAEKSTFELYCENVYNTLTFDEAQRETRANGYKCPQNY